MHLQASPQLLLLLRLEVVAVEEEVVAMMAAMVSLITDFAMKQQLLLQRLPQGEALLLQLLQSQMVSHCPVQIHQC